MINQQEKIPWKEKNYKDKKEILIIDEQTLHRECMVKALTEKNDKTKIYAVSSIEKWYELEKENIFLDAVIINPGRKNLLDSQVGLEIKALTVEFSSIPLILMKDTDDISQILKALEYGAKGYIPTSVDLNICIEAIELAIAGGIFIPAGTILSMRSLMRESNEDEAYPLQNLFTKRERDVAEALRTGKANKIIAYELNLRESTIKVHIRSIMKKLKATNRTEVAYRLNELMSPRDLE